MLKKLIFILVILLPHTILYAQQEHDTVNLYFDLNIATLNAQTQHQIDSLFYNDILFAGINIKIIGYADYLGSEQYNKGLSEKRAKNVAEYLEHYGLKSENIKLCIGEGEIERTGINNKEGYPIDRKVSIVIEHTASPKVDRQPKHITPAPVSKEAIDLDGSLDAIAHSRPGQRFVLRNIYFAAESHDISQSLPALDKLYNILLNYPTLKIQIEGHVCCIVGAPDAYDVDSHDNHLSVNRAKAIYDYLVDRGIDANRLKYVGYGKSRPIVRIERSEADAAKNRRVEIRVLAR